MAPIALLSVSNKKGIVPFAKALTEEFKFQIISSGGTAKALEDASIPVSRISDFTGAPEILGGRVKTLHPKVHGGILAKKSDSSHQSELKEQNIPFIDLVVVNLYPFKETIEKPETLFEEALENIDIGGPTMIRAAAKNHQSVIVLTNPSQYENCLLALKNGEVSKQIRFELALEAFEHTADYDAAIARWMQTKKPEKKSPWIQSTPLKQTLRYGENPHQKASWYSSRRHGWGEAKQIQGKELSTNNLLDLEAAISTIREFGYGTNIKNQNCDNAAVIIKHTNPCGVGISNSLSSAFSKALDADRTSAFGGIVALNCSVDLKTASQLKGIFLECIVAPHFDDQAKSVLAEKKNLRLIELDPISIEKTDKHNVRSILGGVIVQELDDKPIQENAWKVVTRKEPSKIQINDLTFAWKVVRHIRSNAISIASSGQTLGIGAGQMNRIGAAKIALEAAGIKANNAVLASDGFFPFDDTIRLAAKYGISAIIQPGGSIKDNLSIDACNELNLSMIFTGRRHFLH
ncbi:bifunctional phosphoribosylaminoimidazolecarboxamide formyltransferase/IMP cyclohydrolase [Prochlorococcus marinus]|uniref:bifunctional phosphoribosylaminoimidazolecarboxamide formyltransferase/IMP cyclohydrolase n=1 Tax=Prochlorococcus marinus TaxID=1219 RepID=UPI0022B52A06|nr:bifunctional phosphoribosylaminoimidazolecarboxamide formyltransferase/IMP cyclohydrolase [Prochlorococcus marinus]